MTTKPKQVAQIVENLRNARKPLHLSTVQRRRLADVLERLDSGDTDTARQLLDRLAAAA